MIGAASFEFRANHVGYGVNDIKYGYVCQFGEGALLNRKFELIKDGEVVYTGELTEERPVGYSPFSAIYLCDFSSVREKGTYHLSIDGVVSDSFSIGGVGGYEEVLQTLLDFYRAQRCGTDDALLHKACHLNDATAAIDCSGGWHDAGDYIKFMITSSFVTFEMLTTFDYMTSYNMKEALLDKNGQKGIPDILEEARIGMEWILKMTSDVANDNLYFQVSGAEDHKYWRIPEDDDKTGNVGNPRKLHKGWGQNLTGRSVAVLALGSKLWKEYDKEFSDKCLARALEIWEIRSDYPDVIKSEPEDFYGEWTSVDDMLMGAVTLYDVTGDDAYLPFMKHYLKSVNGYYIGWGNIDFLAVAACYRVGYKEEETLAKMDTILEYRLKKSQEHSFYRSSSLAWGTNANYPAEAQMAIMYKMLTGSDKYMEMAQHQRDYLLGANNWNMSFIVGVGHRFPLESHSQLNNLVDLHRGAVVGGPALKSSWDDILNLPKSFQDNYEKYQGDVVYYDWIGDYYTNEVAIDYAAAALFIMSYYYGQIDGTTGIIDASKSSKSESVLLPIQNGRNFQFQLQENSGALMEVCDVRGRVLERVKLQKDGTSFKAAVSSTISTGVYVLRIVSAESVQKVRVYLP